MAVACSWRSPDTVSTEGSHYARQSSPETQTCDIVNVLTDRYPADFCNATDALLWRVSKCAKLPRQHGLTDFGLLRQLNRPSHLVIGQR